MAILRKAKNNLRRSLIYLLYWALQALGFPLLLLYLGLRIVRNRAYLRALPERFGFLPATFHRTVPGAIWLHAVSVGEAITAIQLVRLLRAELPDAPVFVSCGTLAGRAMAEQKLAGTAEGIFYAPVDYRFAVRRVLRALKPALVIVMETEIWPNLWRDARLSGASLLVVNGRISDRALPRYRKYAWFFNAALSWANEILTQDLIAASRYRELGAPNAQDAGNLKFDFDPSATSVPAAVRAFLDRTGPAHTWVAASTMPPAFEGDVDEDDLVIAAFSELAARDPRLLLILVPRRPERFDEAARKLEAAGVPFLRRSALNPDSALALPGVLLLDTIGELGGLFPVADVVFMGGTIASRGGHNVLEPAAFGVPVLTGPHNENFQSIADEFLGGGGIVATSRERLAADVAALLENPQRRTAIGETARRLADGRRGATARALEASLRLYDQALPRPFRAWPVRLLTAPLAGLWSVGVHVDRSAKSRGAPAIDAPVLSVGNLAMGGTGKTPFVLWLCRILAQSGHRAAVLTRGYRRRDGSAVLALLPGETAPVEVTGEEPQLILRDANAAVGIGFDRMQAWQALSARRRFDVALLDDGFQHWRLPRDLDIVLIDVVDPFRGGVFPAGILREPFSALGRADVIVLTRTRAGRNYEGLVWEIRRHSPGALIVRARFEGHLDTAPSGRVGAFCGLGQPEAFRITLRDLGVEPVFLQSFPDHHHYTAEELRPLRAGVDTLLTTEKDLMNIDPALAAELGIVPVRLRLEIEDEARLLKLVAQRIGAAGGRIS